MVCIITAFFKHNNLQMTQVTKNNNQGVLHSPYSLISVCFFIILSLISSGIIVGSCDLHHGFLFLGVQSYPFRSLSSAAAIALRFPSLFHKKLSSSSSPSYQFRYKSRVLTPSLGFVFFAKKIDGGIFFVGSGATMVFNIVRHVRYTTKYCFLCTPYKLYFSPSPVLHFSPLLVDSL